MEQEWMNYLLALHQIRNLGPLRLKALLNYYKDPVKVWNAPLKEWQELGIPKNVLYSWQQSKKEINISQYAKSILDNGIQVLTIFDKQYPQLLKQIYDPPIILFYKGERATLSEKCMAVVGSRRMTQYGRLVTEQFSTYLAESGLVIVSGLAFGVDTIAHQSTVRVEGKTIAVLGGGLNLIFPASNQNLAAEIIQKNGVVMSEFCPDEPSLPGNFPARNRIVAGLSQGVLVTEAAEESGSLITAKLALEQGKEVFAIPGPITSETSKGTALLIKNGATLVTRPEEILETLGLDQKSNIKDHINLSEFETVVVQLIAQEPKHIDELCRELKIKPSEFAATLIKLEIKGVVKNLGAGVYTKI